MKITWRQSVIDGRYHNDRDKTHIEYDYSSKMWLAVFNNQVVFSARTLYLAKVRVNRSIRIFADNIKRADHNIAKIYGV